MDGRTQGPTVSGVPLKADRTMNFRDRTRPNVMNGKTGRGREVMKKSRN